MPRYEVRVVRGDDVLRRDRMYARGSARMLADTWRCSLSPAMDLESVAC